MPRLQTLHVMQHVRLMQVHVCHADAVPRRSVCACHLPPHAAAHTVDFIQLFVPCVACVACQAGRGIRGGIALVLNAVRPPSQYFCKQPRCSVISHATPQRQLCSLPPCALLFACVALEVLYKNSYNVIHYSFVHAESGAAAAAASITSRHGRASLLLHHRLCSG